MRFQLGVRTISSVVSKPEHRPSPLERSPRPIDSGVDIGHVHLRTADIARVHDFYVGVLGFDVIARMPDALFVSAGGYHHHLAFNTWQSKGGAPPPPGTTGLYHVAIRYPTRAALGDALRRLVDAGWPLDESGRLSFVGARLDVDSLLAAGSPA